MTRRRMDRVEGENGQNVPAADPHAASPSQEVELTPEQWKRVEEWRKRAGREPVRFKRLKDQPGKIMVDTEDRFHQIKMLEMFGTADPQVQCHLMGQVIASFPGAGPGEGRNMDRVLEAARVAAGMLNDIQPKDQLEGFLAIQMIAVHNMAMDEISRATAPGQTVLSRTAHLNTAAKLFRMFMSQMEMLKKYRGGGSQKMVIEHVHINEGAKAIVGNLRAGRGEQQENQP